MFIRYNETGKYYEYDTSLSKTGKGPWLILPIDYTQIYNLTSAPLNPNIAYKNQANIFTQNQEINKTNPILNLIDSSQPIDSRKFRILNVNQELYIQSTNDADTAGYGAFRVTRLGDIRTSGSVSERNRIVPLGSWTSYTPTWYTYGGGFGSIGNGTLRGKYTIIGTTVIYTILLHGGSTTNFGSSYWAFSLPFVVANEDMTGSAFSRRNTTGEYFMGSLIAGSFTYGISNSIGIIGTHAGQVSDLFISPTSPFTWATSDRLIINGFYETNPGSLEII